MRRIAILFVTILYSTVAFSQKVEEALRADLKTLGENAFSYLDNNYTVEKAYKIIIDSISEE